MGTPGWSLGRAYLAGLLMTAAAASGAAPYRLGTVDYTLAAAGLAVRGYGESLYRAGLDDPGPRGRLDPSRVPRFDRWSIGMSSDRGDVASTYLANGEMAVPAALILWEVATGREEAGALLREAILAAEVAAFAQGLPLISKAWVSRARPNAFDSEASAALRGSDADASFFSAHTTGAFAAAVYTGYTYQLRHPDSPLIPWLWSGMLGTAAGVGYLRIHSGMHFLSDVVIGAAIGTLCGYGVPWLHLSAPKGGARKEAWSMRRSLGAAMLWSSVADRPVPGLVLTF